MTRTADDLRTGPGDTRPQGPGYETGPEGLSDPMHHPPKSAHIGLDEHNQPSALGSAHATSDGRGYAADQRGIADLIKELRDEATTLLRQEVGLAKTEMSEKASFFAKQGGKLGAGLGVLAVGGLLLLSAIAYAVAALFQHFLDISTATAFTLGFLTVGIIVSIIGWVLFSNARSQIEKEPLQPERTIQSLKEDKQWLTNQTHAADPKATPTPHDPAHR